MGSLNTDQGPILALENGATKSLQSRRSTPKVDLILDLQFGSTGKGLICGYLAETEDYDTVVSANMPNAGHTYISSFDRKYMTKVLPASFVGSQVKTVLLGPGAVFSVDRLTEEMMWLREDQILRIHPNATVLSDTHKEFEEENIERGSTKQGSAAAVIEKMLRAQPVTAKQVLKGTELEPYVASHHEWQIRIDAAERILAEGSQGHSLGINTQFYPYTTSRDCGPAAFLSNLGIPMAMLSQVIGTCRTLPIRVGGDSGDCYPDQEELSWEELQLEPERTTVTNRVRRVFSYSKMQIEESIWWCNPDLVFLNFCNYVPKEYVTNIVAHIDQYSYVRWMGFGPTYHDVGIV